jgi:tight adherence protein B
VSAAVLAAGAAGALAVPAAWEMLGAAEAARPIRRLAAAFAPVLAAGRAGRDASRSERRRLAVLAAATLAAAAWLVAGPMLAVAAALAGPAAAAALLRARRRRWRAGLAAGTPAAATAIADAVAAGHAVPVALAQAARTLPGPLGAELRATAGSIALGAPTGEALARLAERAGTPAVDLLVTAVALQRRAGGPLADLLRELAASLADEARAAADARAATAQARLTALLVSLLPAGGAMLAELAHRGALASLVAAPLAVPLLGLALVLQVSGALVVRRLARAP